MNATQELIDAASDVLGDLLLLASRSGPGPDCRLVRLIDAIKACDVYVKVNTK